MHKILIVEDDDVARMVLEKILTDSGEFTFVVAHDGEQAINLLHTHNDIEAILLDRNMPNMNGMQTIKKIKENSDWASIPVIFQTAADSDAEVIEGTMAGAFYYLKKPFDASLVLSIVRSAVAA